jgi:hypothetical protein
MANDHLDTRHFGGPRYTRNSVTARICDTLAAGVKYEKKDWSWDKDRKRKNRVIYDSRKDFTTLESDPIDLIGDLM